MTVRLLDLFRRGGIDPWRDETIDAWRKWKAGRDAVEKA